MDRKSKGVVDGNIIVLHFVVKEDGASQCRIFSGHFSSATKMDRES